MKLSGEPLFIDLSREVRSCAARRLRHARNRLLNSANIFAAIAQTRFIRDPVNSSIKMLCDGRKKRECESRIAAIDHVAKDVEEFSMRAMAQDLRTG